MDVVEASIADLQAALAARETTSVALVAEYLRRIAAYDRSGIALNAVPVLDPHAFSAAAESDARRAAGATLGPLDGIPYTAKDSYAAKGLPVAAGSPAFARLISQRDAFTIAQLRAGGAVLLGLTNMPPMANGGMQRGVYGRAESPYNSEYLTSAFGSGSSNGSGTATAASFGAFGLGEETWSSGRAPASCNALVAYCPSRGVISVRGNWPLVPTMDVVVPHTRSVADLLALLDVIVADDPDPRGDFWRRQPWIEIPAASTLRPASYRALGDSGPQALRGVRLGVPRMYIGDTSGDRPVQTRSSVVELWRRIADDLRAAGAEVLEVDFPAVTNYEGAATMLDRGLVPAGYDERELWDLSIWGWEEFLQVNGDPELSHVREVDGALIFPPPPGALPDQYDRHQLDLEVDLGEYPARAAAGIAELEQIPLIADGIAGLEATRRIDLEAWMDALGLDAVIHPAVADIGRSDADVNPASADTAWRNGTWVANGNLVPRHLGIPSVTVPMGTLDDIGMPVGLTILGRGYDDVRLLRLACAVEATRDRRTVPPRTPALAPIAWPAAAAADGIAPQCVLSLEESDLGDGDCTVAITLAVDGMQTDAVADARLYVDGDELTLARGDDTFTATTTLRAKVSRPRHSVWRDAYGSLIVALVRTHDGRTSGAWTTACGIA
ncbi:amidase [Mycobacteroides saopaulense]|uniref:Amidase n=1 Tax=Mycobacteroides saopaulense TaxID=1578165 RepID=A0A1X0IVX5_9MYCO|nr:amidase [Mycobacteroides saopaulense]ORB52738.1 amidase [Mycobacteroides saopaulense]